MDECKRLPSAVARAHAGHSSLRVAAAGSRGGGRSRNSRHGASSTTIILRLIIAIQILGGHPLLT